MANILEDSVFCFYMKTFSIKTLLKSLTLLR